MVVPGARQRTRARRTSGRRLGLGALLALLLPAGLLAVVALLAVAARGEALPNVRVGDVAVGGLGAEDARERVAARATALAQEPIRLSLGDQAWTPLPAELGVSYDPAGAVAAAMDAGRDRPLGGLPRTLGLDREPIAVPLPVAFDRARFDAYMDRLDGEVGTPPVDATVSLVGLDAAVTPGHDGRGIDREAARAALMPQIARLAPASVALQERAVPAAMSADQVRSAEARVDRLLAAPMALTANGEAWPVAPEEIAPLLRVVPLDRDSQMTIAVEVDDTGLDALVGGIADQVDTPTTDAWVEAGAVHDRLHAAVAGRTVRREELAAALREAIGSDRHEVAIPVETGSAPAVSTEALMADLGVTEMVALGDSGFAGSDAGRDLNVRLAAERLDGTLVPPGGVFSYNAAIGTLFDSGYAQADATIEGSGGTAEGGGVCQVSTTVFRAALNAGLPIVEWWPHSYRSPFYEQQGWSAGFDAAIVQVYGDDAAGTDLRFQNPTDGWILVGARVDEDAHLVVELRGTDPGYTVEFGDPITEWTAAAPAPEIAVDPALAPGDVVEERAATEGLTVSVVRRVYDGAGNEIATDTFVSPYQPRAAVQRVGPDAAPDVD